MTTKQIDYCIELARTQSFSRGSENLFVSQPTFSYQIKLLEEEVGFDIFERNGKGATLSPAGQKFQYEGGMDSFLKNETDILFALKEHTKQLAGTIVHELFKSHIYLITDKDDPLASKNIITDKDIYGRTLMVGGGSPALLRSVQQKLMSSGKISYFNSPDHETTLTNVAAGRGICLAPGFLNDHSGQFAWIPYDCKDVFDCVLCTHKTDNRESLQAFISTLKQLYDEAVAFPL